MQKLIKILSIVCVLLSLPSAAFALTIPQTPGQFAGMLDIGAKSYAVMDATTGQIIFGSNTDSAWAPASLTKLVTALVVLDTKPKLYKSVAITTQDQTAGACGSGGACIRTRPGIKYTVDGLFHAALLPSANNAASALARSTGLSTADFVERMNLKAESLGALHSHFNEPTGMDPSNTITAEDYAHIVTAAFSNAYLRQIAGLTSYYLKSTNSRYYSQIIKNTDKLLSDGDIQILGAKTGYLDEAQYNFAALLKNRNNQELAVVVLGEDHLSDAFAETKLLADMAGQWQYIALLNNGGSVLGASTGLNN